MAPAGFVMQLKNFFGFKPGQTPSEFAQEVKPLLNPTLKAEFTEMLNKAGYPAESK